MLSSYGQESQFVLSKVTIFLDSESSENSASESSESKNENSKTSR